MCFDRPKYRHTARDSEQPKGEVLDVIGPLVRKLDQEAIRPRAPSRARLDETEVVPLPGERLQEITQGSRPVVGFDGERCLELPNESPRSVDLGSFFTPELNSLFRTFDEKKAGLIVVAVLHVLRENDEAIAPRGTSRGYRGHGRITQFGHGHRSSRSVMH